jgi:hypothetical protein
MRFYPDGLGAFYGLSSEPLRERQFGGRQGPRSTLRAKVRGKKRCDFVGAVQMRPLILAEGDPVWLEEVERSCLARSRGAILFGSKPWSKLGSSGGDPAPLLQKSTLLLR